MVKLGFIKEAEQAPRSFPRVYVRPAENPLKDAVETTVYSWPNEEGAQVFELALDVSPGVESLDEWVEPMGRILRNMGWNKWWLDAFSISMVLDRYLTESLKQWGLKFWKHYDPDAVVLIQVGVQRDAVMPSVNEWRSAYPGLVAAPEYDFEDQERRMVAQNKNRSRKIRSLFRPKFFSAKKREAF